jgi:tetratricopeptide (TPR) repeat protein
MNLASVGGRPFVLGFLGVLVAGLAIAYGNSFGVGFYFDDSYGIQDNPAIRSLANVPSFFTDPFTLTIVRENVDIRPVLVTTYALNYAVSGNDPWSYHALNLLIHLVTAWMVFLLVRDHLWWPESRRGPDGSARFPAAAAALFFALAPLNNQAVNYMWARSALLCTALYVGAFLALMNRRLFAAVLLHTLALLTKAIALTMPAMFVAYDYLYRDRERHPDLRSWLRDWKDLVPPLLPFVLVNVAYLVARHLMLPEWMDEALHQKWVTPWIWMMSQWSAMLHYAHTFVWPAVLSVDHDFPYAMAFAEPRAWGALVVIAAWVGAALYASRRFPHVAFATVWFFVTLAPESTIAPLAEVINDHRPYIASSLGLSVLLAWLLERASLYAGKRRFEAFTAAVLVLCLGAAVVGHGRTNDWATSDGLWDATVRSSPNNGRAWMNSGLGYFRKGNLKEARRRYERARQLLPAYPYLYMNLSLLEAAEGNRKGAVSNARQGVRLGPTLAPTHYHLGLALEGDGNTKEAAAAYRRALEVDPRLATARTALARLEKTEAARVETATMAEGLRLLDEAGDPAGAAAKFREVLEKVPGHYGATFQLARALEAGGRREDARPLWEKMLALAEEAGDGATLALVREKLAAPGPEPDSKPEPTGSKPKP